MPSGEEASARGEPSDTPRDTRDTDDDASSVVRPSAPTLQEIQGEAGSGPRSPVVIRTPLPPPLESLPTPLDRVVGPLVTTTPTGKDPIREGDASSRVDSTLRSGPPSSPRGLVGVTLGRYQIIEELGHGGMATVYRAHDPRLGRDVALKVIHRHLRDNGEIAQRFRHEARAVAKLKHPSIVEIYDVPDEAEDGERFLVAELVDGPSLRKYLQNGKSSPGAPPMPAEIAAALVLQVLGALGRAHEEGIVHRDVKPENILLAQLNNPTPSQRPSDPSRTPPVAKLTDFGIAKLLDAQGMTSTGQILGSPAHMAPEQIEGGDISARVDIFAVGVLFYELATGSLPFDGKNPAQVIRRVLDGEFTPAERQAPTVGGRWSAIIGSMLARDAEKRPGTAEEVAQAIRSELDAMGVTDPNRELVEYLRNPADTSAGWGARLKPKLLERAIAARASGDVVGGANDLNRALAYDPSDPKLVRAVTTLRTRERRMRQLRRGLPLALAAVVVSGGTFGVVRWARNRAKEKPVPSVTAGASTKPSTTVSTPASTTVGPIASSVVANVVDAGPTPSTTTHSSNTVGIVPTTDAGKVTGTRTVHFTLFPPEGKFRIDGGPELDPFKAGDQELPMGDHTITASGTEGCCVPFSGKLKIGPGEGVITYPIKLRLRDTPIYVRSADGSALPQGTSVTTTVTNKAGVILVQGAEATNVPMSDTTMDVTITVGATGFQKKSEPRTLKPGDAVYVKLTPE